MAHPTKTRVKATEYYQLPDFAEHDLIQLIDGDVVIGSPSTTRHQAIVGEILFLLMTHAKASGGQAFTAPNTIFSSRMYSIFPRTQSAKSRKNVWSAGTAKFDRQEKYQAYQQHGVREYWIVDPAHETVEVWTLHEGEFARQGAYADSFQSAILSAAISVESLF